jgi:hypothetical protein
MGKTWASKESFGFIALPGQSARTRKYSSFVPFAAVWAKLWITP